MRLPLNNRTSTKAAQQAILLLFFTNLAAAASAILGIDLGQEFIKAALVKPGIPLEIVLTKDTKRKEVSAVGFKPTTPSAETPYIYPERLYGADAVNLAARFPNDVYPNLKQLLGKHIFHEAILQYSSRYPALNLMPSPLRSTTSFVSKAAPPDAQNDQSFTVEELLAMQLRDVRRNAEEMAGKGSKIKDVVFTVPVFFTAEERQALQLAAEIAGLRVLAMMNDGTAVALNFATGRNFLPGQKELHVIYDMGAGSTTATVVEIEGKAVKDVGRFKKNVTEINVRGTGWDAYLGGDLFNQKIADHLLEEFVNTPKGKAIQEEGKANAKEAVKLNGRSAAKLWREASKVRHVLSANSETKASIESLYEDIDFRSEKITRAQFEEWLAEYKERITKPIDMALTMAGVPTEDITSVIVHGGGVRTPYVGKLLEELVGEGKISKTVNSDEAAVMGATFRGAGLSNSFRVKEINIRDVNPYVTAIKYKKPSDEIENTLTIFPPNYKLGSEYTADFLMTDDFAILLAHHMAPAEGEKERFEGIAQYMTKNLTQTHIKLNTEHGCTPDLIKTQARFILRERDGLPEMTGIWSGCDVEYEDVPEPPKKGKDSKEGGGIVDDVKGFLGLKKKTAQDKSSSTEAAAESTEEAKPEPKIITKFESIPLEVEILKAGIPALSDENKSAMTARLDGFDQHDADRRARDTHFNDLESFVYKIRELVSDESYIAAAPQAVLSTLSEKASAVSDWLYEAEHSTAAELKAKLAELKELFDPIHQRREEHARRPDQMGLLNNALEQTKQLVELMNEAIEQDKEKLAKAEAEAAAEATAAPAEPVEKRDGEDSSSSSTSTTTTAKPLPTPRYLPSEVSELQSLASEVATWIEEKTAAQAALALHEDPAVTLKDIEAKILHVNQKIMAVISRRAKVEYEEEQAREKAEKEEKRRKAREAREEKKRAKEEKERKKAEEKEKKEGHDEL